MTKKFFTPLFCWCFWIRDPGWVKIRIWDKHPGSATLPPCASNFYNHPCVSQFCSRTLHLSHIFAAEPLHASHIFAAVSSMCLTFLQQGPPCVSHFRSRTLNVSHIFTAGPSMCLTFSQQSLHMSHIFSAGPSTCLTFSQQDPPCVSHFRIRAPCNGPCAFLCLLNLPFQKNWTFNLEIFFYFFKQLNIIGQLAIWHFFRKAPHRSHGRRRSGKTTEHKLYCIPKIREKTHFMQCLVEKFK